MVKWLSLFILLPILLNTYNKIRSNRESLTCVDLSQTECCHLVVINDIISHTPAQVNNLKVKSTLSTVMLQQWKSTAKQRVSFSFEV